MFSIVNLVITIFLIIGTVLLQIKLAKSESRWPGFVLPVISFLFALLSVFSMASTLILMNEIIRIQDIIQLIIFFLLFNIPALILLAIYFSTRKKLINVSEMEKMTIQDLE